MRDDFAVFILTHGRPDNIKTIRSLEVGGYTGKWFLVIDDLDERGDEYRERYGDRVVVFSKPEIEPRMDLFDQGGNHKTITYARNACWDIARRLGVRYFCQLDDDYIWFGHRTVGRKVEEQTDEDVHGWQIKQLDGVFDALVDFLAVDPRIDSVAFSQGGDHMGGKLGWRTMLMRKAMNSFVCDVERPIDFLGRMNEDVNTYVTRSLRGRLFFTFTPIQLNQKETQSQEGGITDLYLERGTYQKAFSTLMTAPSAVRISTLGRSNHRLHHSIDWNACAPKIVSEDLRKPDTEPIGF